MYDAIAPNGAWLTVALDLKGSKYACGLCDNGRGCPYEDFVPSRTIEQEHLFQGPSRRVRFELRSYQAALRLYR